MGRHPGSPKGPSGRKKGTPNKSKKTIILEELCEQEEIEPFVELLRLCLSDDLPIRLGALKEVCSYLYPKRKAIEISENPLKPFGASSEVARLEALRAVVKARINERK